MFKNKKNKKVKINKSEIEKNPSSVSSFDNSVLSNYSKWREDYSEVQSPLDDVESPLDTEKEVDIDEIVEDVEKNTDFTINLINSDIGNETFTEKEDTSLVSVEEKKVSIEEDNSEIEKDFNVEKDEILTETQRLKLIYGNVTPLYERRKLGKKFEKVTNKDIVELEEKEQEKDNIVKIKNKEDLIDIKAVDEPKKVKKELREIPQEEIYKIPKVPKILKLLFALSMVFGILVIGFFGLKAYYSLNVRFPSIIENIEKKDKVFYSNNIIFNGESKLTEEKITSFLNDLNENGDNLDILKKWIKDDADNLKKDNNYISTRPIRLQKNGKILGVFDDYKIFIDPIKLKVEKSDKVETFILLDGKEEPISVEEYSLFPGDYTVFYNDNGVKLKNKIKLFPTENNEVVTVTYGEDTDYEIANDSIKLDVNAKDSNFRIITRDEESIIFVNDKNTGLTVKDYNSLSGTDIKLGDEIKVVTKMPWGYNISQGVKYNGENSLTVSNSLSDPKLLEVAISKSLKLFKEDVYARGAKDETVLTVMVDEALDYAKNRIQGLINSKRNYLGGFISMEFDLNSFEIRPYKDTYEMYIGGHLLVQETTYSDNSNAPQISTIDPVNEKIGIHFIFDKEKKDWYCNVWGFTTRYISRDNIRSVDISKDMIVR